MSQDAGAIIDAVKSEKLLAGSQLLVQIGELRESLQYRSDGTLFSFDDYYFALQRQIDALPRLALKPDIAPNTESQYQNQLITALEAIYDDCERITGKLLHFLSKLKGAQERMETLKASFVAWYSLAAAQYLASYDVDLGKTVVADLAKAEFERLMQGLDVEVASLIEAVNVQVKVVNKRKQFAQEKFSLGKDQANESWTSRLLPAAMGTNSDPGSRELLIETEEAEEEDDEPGPPGFVSQVPSVVSPPALRGTFHKTGDPALATPVAEVTIGPSTPVFIPRKNQKEA